MAEKSPSYTTHVPSPGQQGVVASDDAPQVPIRIVTKSTELPVEFLEPSSEKNLIIGFDCEGVGLCRTGALCIMQFAFHDAVYIVDAIKGGAALIEACKPALESDYITKVIHDCKRDSEALYFQFGIKLHNVMDTQIAYALIEEQETQIRVPDVCISFVSLLADIRYCGFSYSEKQEVRSLMSKNRQFWEKRPFSEMMIRAAADDVRFLPYIYHQMMLKLNNLFLWRLAVRGALYCRSFCIDDTNFAGWPSPPPVPAILPADTEAEILYVLDVPDGLMGRVIGRNGSTIVSFKEQCSADIIIGGKRGPLNKVIIIGLELQVRKAEAMIRGSLVL